MLEMLLSSFSVFLPQTMLIMKLKATVHRQNITVHVAVQSNAVLTFIFLK